MDAPISLAPALNAKAFKCPHRACGIYAQQYWGDLVIGDGIRPAGGPGFIEKPFRVAKCCSCSRITLWDGERLVYPVAVNAPEPQSDMPPEIATIFEEARLVAAVSPRASSALLRLCVEKLCGHLDAEGSDLDKKVAWLVTKGLANAEIARAMHIIRIVGNDAVHAGTIFEDDDEYSNSFFFGLLNRIVERLIGDKRKDAEMWSLLPSDKTATPTKRDGL